MPIRSFASPALAASLVMISGQALAGPALPTFNWINPIGGDWYNPANWDQNAVPGYAATAGADVVIDATGDPFLLTFPIPLPPYPNKPIALGIMTLDGPVTFVVGIGAQDFHTVRELSAQGNSWFRFYRIVNVLDDVTIGEHARMDAGAGRLVVGGALRNQGHLELTSATIEATSVVNDGLISTLTTTALSPREFIVSDAFINNGTIVMDNRGFSVRGHMIQRGSIDIAASSGFRINGDLTIEDGATFTGAGSLVLQGEQGEVGEPRTVAGNLAFGGRTDIQYGGAWTFRGAVDLGSLYTYETSLDAVRFEDDLRTGILSLAAVNTAHFQSVRTTGLAQISSTSIEFAGHAEFVDDVQLGGASLIFHDSYEFGADLTLSGVTAHLQHGLDVAGNLTVTNNARITIGENTTINARGGDIAWFTPLLDLDIPLIASDEIAVGARRLNAAITARQIRIGSALTDLNTDLSADQQVLIAGANLSIGAVGEIAQRTIHGDLGTTFALSQGWDFDIEGSASRGEAASDTLTITGDATIYGVLRVHALGGSNSFRAGDEFTLFAADSIDATFRFVSLPALEGDLSLELIVDQTTVRVVVIPAPGAISAFAACGLATMRRRRPR